MKETDSPLLALGWSKKALRPGSECCRGIAYKDTGAPAAAGTKGQVRKISTGRKARGSASDDFAKQSHKA